SHLWDIVSLLKNVNPYLAMVYTHQKAFITSSKLWYSVLVKFFTTKLYQA
ncbi:MAG: hypothetical protein QG588_464, partial [Candidatus Poribacteria bacterium]|nr:hypothetical protein [Candidatus Poribacteria bacterium]